MMQLYLRILSEKDLTAEKNLVLQRVVNFRFWAGSRPVPGIAIPGPGRVPSGKQTGNKILQKYEKKDPPEHFMTFLWSSFEEKLKIN